MLGRISLLTILITLVIAKVSYAQSLGSSSPSANSTNINSSSNITLNFDSNVDQSTVDLSTTGDPSDDNIIISGSQTGLINGAFSGDGTSTITFDPISNFKPGELITVNITEGVQNTSGDPVMPESFQFTVATGTASGIYYEKWTIESVSLAGSIDVVDINEDGHLDILSGSTSFNGDLYWFQNNGDQSFSKFWIGRHNQISSVEGVDMDNDGDLDVLCTVNYDDKIIWYANNGNQVFTEHVILDTINAPLDALAVDIDNDGDIDVIAASFLDDKIVLFENTGASVFVESEITSQTDGIRSLFTSDMDGDGDLDILSASSLDNSIRLFTNNGSSSFTSNVISASANGAYSVKAADMDNDGDLDVISALYNDDKFIWFENDDLLFTEHEFPAMSDGANSISVSDVDGDGDQDFFGTSFNDSKIVVYINEGNQMFTEEIITSSALGISLVYPADLDNDGDIDFVSSLNSDDDKLAWHENYNNGTEITSFSFPEQTGPSTIGPGTIYVEVEEGTDLSILIPSFDHSTGASVEVLGTPQVSGITANDFSTEVTYVITAEDGTTIQNWVVNVTEAVTLSSATEITSFSLAEQTDPATIGTGTINIEVENGTDLSSLIANFTLSAGATAEVLGTPQASGNTVNDFSSEIIYVITAEDGNTIQNWVVTVTESVTLSSATEITSFSFPEQTGPTTIGSGTINIEVEIGTDLSVLISSFTLSPGATAEISGSPQVSGTTVNDFSTKVTYVITAEDGFTTQNWVVTVGLGPGTGGGSNNGAFVTRWKDAIVIHTSENYPTSPHLQYDYNYTIKWTNLTNAGVGDGIVSGVSGSFFIHSSGSSHSLERLNEGDIYQVEITGAIPFLQCGDGLISVENWGLIEWENLWEAFSYIDHLTIHAVDVPDLRKVEDMSYLFYGNPSFNADLSNWDVSNVRDFSSMFAGDSVFSCDLSSWNMGNARDISSMFYAATSFNQDISNWNVGQVENMSTVFYGASSFNQNLGNWDIGGINPLNGMSGMLSNTAMSVSNYDSTIIGWADDLNGTQQIPGGLIVGGIIFSAEGLKYQKSIRARNKLAEEYNWSFHGDEFVEIGNRPFVSRWQTNDGQIVIPSINPGQGFDYDVRWVNATDPDLPSGELLNQTGSTYITGLSPIHEYIVSIFGTMPKIKIASGGIDNATKIKTIVQWGDIAYSSMEGAFALCTDLKIIAEDGPYLDLATDVSEMFKYADSLTGNLNSWNVSTIEDMSDMFFGAEVFNSDLDNWNVGNVVNMEYMFRDAKSFNGNISNWGVNNVENMQGMLYHAESFDQDLGKWNLFKVTNMAGMLDYTAMSVVNYDSTLIGWEHFRQKYKPKNPEYIRLGAADLIYSDSAALSRGLLIDDFGWIIEGDKTMPTIKFNVSDKVYGQEPFELVAESNSDGYIYFESSDEAIVEIDKQTATIKSAGNVVIRAIQDEDQNFIGAKDSTSIEITKADLTIVADDKKIGVNDPLPTFTMTISGFVYDDDESEITLPELTTTAQTTSKKGTYPITLIGGESENYRLLKYDGELEIIEYPLSVDNVQELSIYPNPVNQNFLNIDFPSPFTGEVNVYDVGGSLKKNLKYKSVEQLNIPSHIFCNGLNIVEIVKFNGEYVKVKIVKN
ncbi:MAG: BspA family leucine-rich repeat surface protein [Bacteroidota bacterium]